MKTDDLIALLATDTAPVRAGRVPMRVALAGVAATGVALVALVVWLGIRPDIAGALQTFPYWMKTAYTAGLAVAGFLLVERLARPGAFARTGSIVLGVCLAAIAVIAVYQLSQTPAGDMRAAVMGSSWNRCPWRILALTAPGLIALLWVMRGFAPTRPALAGAAAGLLAGGLAATVYGLYCQETAAPFVAIFYTLGITLSCVAGAVIGSRMLRW